MPATHRLRRTAGALCASTQHTKSAAFDDASFHGLKFRSGSFHGLSQQTEAQQLNIFSILFDSNDGGSCGDALGPAVASFSARRVVLVVLVVVKSSHRLVVFH